MNDMERKIGEIFKYNGEWYQCLRSPDGTCTHCNMCFDGKCPVPIKECTASGRRDKTYVIFKKLEKVGEPYNIGTHIYQRYKVFMKPYIFNDSYFAVNPAIDDEFISIEIKQNKEDMIEKKQKLDKLVDDYMACRIQYAEFDKEIKALYDKEESEPTLKEFDLEAARSGKPVCTRDGRKARIICFDKTPPKGYEDFKIVALINNNDNEDVHIFNEKGKKYSEDCRSDLMMLPEKKEGWVNVYDADTTFYFVEGRVYDTKEEAIKHINPDHKIYTTTVKIEWEK